MRPVQGPIHTKSLLHWCCAALKSADLHSKQLFRRSRNPARSGSGHYSYITVHVIRFFSSHAFSVLEVGRDAFTYGADRVFWFQAWVVRKEWDFTFDIYQYDSSYFPHLILVEIVLLFAPLEIIRVR